jgi:hypothetical protein
MSKLYYALNWSHGLGMYWADDPDNLPVATVETFNSKAERDSWVKDDPLYNGNVNRSTVDAKEARRIMIHNTDFWGTGWEDCHWEIPQEELVRAYAGNA